jgi:hypothetical protein
MCLPKCFPEAPMSLPSVPHIACQQRQSQRAHRHLSWIALMVALITTSEALFLIDALQGLDLIQ